MEAGVALLNSAVSEKYIGKIAEALWNHRAAVMVGTGFSRDAEKASEDVAPVPLWGSLAKKMKQQLACSEKHSVDVLSLASEYEAQFGRQELERFLRDQISDMQYLPGDVHKGLVSLPWTDIFTTNYDTLLERTDAEANGSSYDIVQTNNDIAMCRSSRRIVKLHGSFSLTGSIIFTEEDYRTYPVSHAPFVNMVQQSMMENVFCLLGFSGTDPNFMHWLGWVRDNLGSNMPKVYLCGIFDIPEGTRMNFARKNVSIVDFDSLVEGMEYSNEDERQKDAMRRFFLRLRESEPPSIMEWGCGKKNSSDEPLADVWKREREAYPGWVIAPYRIRNRMEADCSRHRAALYDMLKSRKPMDQLACAYEFTWRIDRMLGELNEAEVQEFVDILKSVHLFSSLSNDDTAATNDTSGYGKLDLAYLKKAWVELAFTVLRWMREHNSERMYPELKDILGRICPISKKWMSHLHHENCLKALSAYERKSIIKELEDWKKDRNEIYDDFWMAAFYAEIDELEEAERLTVGALAETRRRLHGSRERNVRLLSLKSWGKYLLHAIRCGMPFGTSCLHRENEFEWENEESILGNPQLEVEYLASKTIAWNPSDSCTFSTSFDPGKTVEKISFVSYPIGIPAFSWYRLHGAAPLPVNCGMYRINCRADSEAFQDLWHARSCYSLPWLLRIANVEDMELLIGRWQMACMSQSDVSVLLSLSMQGLRESILFLRKYPEIAASLEHSTARSVMERMTELLSRLCFRIKEDERDEVFSLAVRCNNESVCRRTPSFWKLLGNLWERMFLAMSSNELRKHLAVILELPMPGEPGFEMAGYFKNWPEPFSFIGHRSLAVAGRMEDEASLRSKIERLVSLIGDGQPETRRRALRRVSALYEAGLLDTDLCHRLGLAIWRRKADNQLPDSTGFLWSSCLSWPGASEEHATDRLRSFLNHGEFETMNINSNGEMERSGVAEYEHEWRLASRDVIEANDAEKKEDRIDWTQDEMHVFLEKAIRRMFLLVNDIHAWAKFPSSMMRKERELDSIIATVVVSVCPYLQEIRDNEWKSFQELLEKLKEERIPHLLLRVSFSLLGKDGQEAADIIREGLMSSKERDVIDSYGAIWLWMAMYRAQQGVDNDVPRTLLGQAVRGVLMRRSMKMLPTVLHQMAKLIQRFPDAITDAMMDDFSQAAIYLHEETQIVAGESLDSTVYSDRKVDVLPEILSATAHLIKSMHEWYCLGGKEEPEIIDVWRRKCVESVLPEVKRWA